MNSIVLLIPYFGKCPNYLPVFLHTAHFLDSSIDFILFSDFELSIPSSKNIRYIRMTWNQMIKLIESKGLIPPYSSYKLTDYKPAYGYLFEEYIMGYEYWGYCDVDLVLGDVPSFLKAYNYKNYDRFGKKGHFTIYKNTIELRSLFKCKCSDGKKQHCFDYVVRTTYPCHFDEEGMNIICKENNISFFEGQLELNTAIDTKYLHTWSLKNYPQLFVWADGHTYTFYMDNGIMNIKEAMYIHHQFQKNMPTLGSLDDFHNQILITHKGFIYFNRDKLNDYFLEYGVVETELERSENIKLFRRSARIKRIKNLIMEFRVVGLRAFVNVYYRLPSLFALIKQHTF